MVKVMLNLNLPEVIHSAEVEANLEKQALAESLG